MFWYSETFPFDPLDGFFFIRWRISEEGWAGFDPSPFRGTSVRRSFRRREFASPPTSSEGRRQRRQRQRRRSLSLRCNDLGVVFRTRLGPGQPFEATPSRSKEGRKTKERRHSTIFWTNWSVFTSETLSWALVRWWQLPRLDSYLYEVLKSCIFVWSRDIREP